MPIVEIEIVTQPGEILNRDLAQQLADLLGEVFSSEAGGTWVKLKHLPMEQYAENNGGPPPNVYPIFVSVLNAHNPDINDLEKEMISLSSVIGRVCNRPQENVHILYQPNAVGRIGFGGNLLADQ